ncbi:MAG: tetratricopeptide repeat protein [Planctomycetes bacterium]|nr:tetratricopeptide repeat protein [Planctomycetota bacterium]
MMTTTEPTPIVPRARSAVRSITYPLLIAAAVGLTFSPAREYGFVNWDDPANFIENTAYRGFSFDTIHWAFTTYHLGHYQPLNWLSFAADHALAGLNPRRFHVTQITLHIVAALCVHQLVRKLLPLFRLQTTPARIDFAAAATALLFAVHPLRVESVVWLSARTDILALIFMCLSTLAYLRHANASRQSFPWASFAFFVAAVLSKEHAVVLPALLILLDWYPLRRLRADSSCLNQEHRPICREKLPFLLISILGSCNAVLAAGSSVASMDKSPLTLRLAQIPFSIAFYLWKTVAPGRLSHFYEFPGNFGLDHPSVIVSLVACGMIAFIVTALRTKAPGLVLAAIAYLVILAPVSGIMQRGPQLAADRYSYLATMPLYVLLGSALARAANRSGFIAACIAISITAVWSPMARLQVANWRSSFALWQSAIDYDDHNATARALLAHVHMNEGRIDDAIREFETALRIRPTQPLVHRNLAALYSRQNRLDDAILHYEADLAENPADAASRYFLGACYERRGDPDRASKQFRAALDINPDLVPAHLGLARLFLNAAYVEEAEPRLRRVLELDPENAPALELLAQLCANTGRADEAARYYDRAIVEAERRHQTAAADKLRTAKASLAASTPSR